jgi:hypothetical protein
MTGPDTAAALDKHHRHTQDRRFTPDGRGHIDLYQYREIRGKLPGMARNIVAAARATR